MKNPWIPEREISICPWEPDSVRGDYSNPYASVLPSVYRFSKRQMAKYMKMIKQFGYRFHFDVI